MPHFAPKFFIFYYEKHFRKKSTKEVANLSALAQQETDAKADAALLNNGVLPETTLQEYNQKATNEVEISVIAKGNVSSTAQNFGFT